MSSRQQESLDKGINLFNEQRYFEAHEEWEDEWRLMNESEDRALFHGLIMASAAFHHYVRRECAAAAEMLERSLPYLRRGREGHPDIGIGEFIDDLSRLRGPFALCSFDLNASRLPIIHRNLVNW